MEHIIMAYGTAAGVAGHAKTWTRGGVFYDASISPLVAATNPSLTEVNTWLTQVSDMFDRALSNEGFVVPLIAEKSVNLITLEVERIVGDLCARANGMGRLVSDGVLHIGYMRVIANEIKTWVTEGATGFENDGVPRTNANAAYTGGYSVVAQRDV